MMVPLQLLRTLPYFVSAELNLDVFCPLSPIGIALTSLPCLFLILSGAIFI